MQFIKNKNMPLSLQLVKNDLTYEELAIVSYTIYQSDTTTLELSGSVSYNTLLNSYTTNISPSADWVSQEPGNYILVWAISDTDFFTSTMIEYLSIINDNELKLDALINTTVGLIEDVSVVQDTIDDIETKTISLSGDIVNTSLDIKRVLGLVHDNVSLDQTTYDRFYNMKTARMRIYNNPDSIGTDNDVIGEYKIESNSDRRGTFINWKQTRIS